MCQACLGADHPAPRLSLSARHRLRSGGQQGLAALAALAAPAEPEAPGAVEPPAAKARRHRGLRHRGPVTGPVTRSVPGR